MTTLHCPTCRTLIEWSDAYPERPFCSPRCKLIDLGEWASEGHRIQGPTLPVDPSLMDSDALEHTVLDPGLIDPEWLDHSALRVDHDDYED